MIRISVKVRKMVETINKCVCNNLKCNECNIFSVRSNNTNVEHNSLCPKLKNMRKNCVEYFYTASNFRFNIQLHL